MNRHHHHRRPSGTVTIAPHHWSIPSSSVRPTDHPDDPGQARPPGAAAGLRRAVRADQAPGRCPGSDRQAHQPSALPPDRPVSRQAPGFRPSAVIVVRRPDSPRRHRQARSDARPPRSGFCPAPSGRRSRAPLPAPGSSSGQVRSGRRQAVVRSRSSSSSSSGFVQVVRTVQGSSSGRQVRSSSDRLVVVRPVQPLRRQACAAAVPLPFVPPPYCCAVPPPPPYCAVLPPLLHCRRRRRIAAAVDCCCRFAVLLLSGSTDQAPCCRCRRRQPSLPPPSSCNRQPCCPSGCADRAVQLPSDRPCRAVAVLCRLPSAVIQPSFAGSCCHQSRF